jgi:hypothetical protein
LRSKNAGGNRQTNHCQHCREDISRAASVAAGKQSAHSERPAGQCATCRRSRDGDPHDGDALAFGDAAAFSIVANFPRGVVNSA